MVEEVSLKRKIAQAKKAADSCKNNESWGLVNEVTEQNFFSVVLLKVVVSKVGLRVGRIIL